MGRRAFKPEEILKEAIIVPTYKRPEFLYCCLRRIRAIEKEAEIFVFPDRGSMFDEDLKTVMLTPEFQPITLCWVPPHNYHGNSYNVLEAMRAVWNMQKHELIYYIEDDVMIHADFFDWHRFQHEDEPDIFASMAWVFNRYAPLTDDALFQPWYYAIGTCFHWKNLAKVVQHATPLYYDDMRGYIEKAFPKSKLNSPFGIEHFEQDGLIQRVLDLDRSQTVSSGITKCDHLGVIGYNRGWSRAESFYENCTTLKDRILRIEELIADPYWRAQLFGRDIIEREIGKELPKRNFRYEITTPQGWKSEFTSELDVKRLPSRINSVPVTPGTKIVLLS
jgi:hypothetical protein